MALSTWVPLSLCMTIYCSSTWRNFRIEYKLGKVNFSYIPEWYCAYLKSIITNFSTGGYYLDLDISQS